MTVLHAGGKFGGGAYKVSGGLHGVGASVVNALAAKMWVEVRRDGKVYRQEYERGIPKGSLKTTPEPEAEAHRHDHRHGSPTTTIFDAIDYEYDALLQRFREMAYLTKGIWIRFEDKRDGREREMNFCFEGGVASFVRHINRGRNTLIAAPDLHREDRRHDAGRVRDPVQRRLRTGGVQLRQHHQHHRRRRAPHRLPLRADARAERLRAQEQVPQGRRRQPQRRRRPRGPRRRHQREAPRAAVRGPDEDAPRQRRGRRRTSSPPSPRASRSTSRSTRPTAAASSRRASWPRGRARPPARRATSSSARACSTARCCPASWPTAPSATPSSASCTSSRETAPAAPPRAAATAASRRSCRSAARSSTSRRPAWRRCWRTRRSAR